MRQAQGLLAVPDEELVACLQSPLVNPEQAEFAQIWVRCDVKDAGEEGFARVVGIDKGLFVFAGADEERARVAFGWTREVSNHGVEQCFHACAAQGIRETDGDDVCLIHGALEGLVKRLIVRLFPLEVAFHQRVVDLHDLIEQLRVKAGDGTQITLALAVQEAINDLRAAICRQVDW